MGIQPMTSLQCPGQKVKPLSYEAIQDRQVNCEFEKTHANVENLCE